MIKNASQLVAALADIGPCVVAFSGGVDSAVVAKAASLALGNLGLGDLALAAIGVGAALADGELESAREAANAIGIALVEVRTDELARPDYVRNAGDRCYHCKSELYEVLARVAAERGIATIVNGANADDLGDYRPGMKAAAEFSVRSPLAELGITKAEVRALAQEWNLPVWDKPATPCLASRIAYGQEVSPERLRMIDAAEQYLRGLGLRDLRVRYHEGDLARIEAPLDAIARLSQPEVREPLAKQLKTLGFKFVTIDLAGIQSGSLNQLLPILQ
jgi:pyridinium-3,5-biscarboxylic acid mononucleotide sulfurtransferase